MSKIGAAVRFLGRPFAFGPGLGIGLAICLGAMQGAPEEVRAMSFVVVDAEGRERGAFKYVGEVEVDTASLQINNPAGGPAVFLHALEGAGSVSVSGGGFRMAWLTSGRDGPPGVVALDDKGRRHFWPDRP